MKKIVGIIAAVAMAASVFAVDFSANVKVEGSLFDIAFTDGAKPSALRVVQTAGGMHWGTRFQTAFYGDKAGAQFAIGGNLGWGWQGTSVWVQPIDQFKLTFLYAESKLNQVFDYGDQLVYFVAAGTVKSPLKFDDNDSKGAWNFEIKPADTVTINLVLGNEWLNAGFIGNTGLTFKFGADFGTIGAIVKYKQTVASKNNLGFGLGYSGSFDPVSLFVDVGLDTQNDFAKMTLAADAQLGIGIDDLSINTYLFYVNDLVGGANDFMADNTLGFRFKLMYTIDSTKPYLKVNADDLMANAFGMEIQPGVEFNIGAAHCDVGINVKIAAKTALTVPFYVEVGF